MTMTSLNAWYKLCMVYGVSCVKNHTIVPHCIKVHQGIRSVKAAALILVHLTWLASLLFMLRKRNISHQLLR